MNVSPIRQSPMPERHVQFSEYVEVRHIQPSETTTATTAITPSLHAQRLEHQLRNAPITPQPQPRPEPSAPVRAGKNLLHSVSLACAFLFIPSFACVALGPIGLIAPAALIVTALVCLLLGGKPTEEMLRVRAVRHAQVREYDPR